MTRTTATLRRLGVLGFSATMVIGAPLGVAQAFASPVAEFISISADDVAHPDLGAPFAITGLAPAGSTVTLHLHKRGTAPADYSLLQTATASVRGDWAATLPTDDDYRYYATANAVTSTTLLSQPAAPIDAPLEQVVAKRSGFTISGTAIPNAVVFLHLHAAGTPADDYSILGVTRANAAGTWTRVLFADGDYRLFSSRSDDPNELSDLTYLVQAR